MFIFNFKVDGNKLSKILFTIMILIIIIILGFAIYNIFFKENVNNNELVKVSDTIKSDDIFEITASNYTNILKAVNDNVDNYIGCKIHFTGYVYRLLDFDDSQFVLARDMVVSNDTSQALVVGFLCNYENANNFEDGTWVDVIGEVTKGDFNGELAIINVIKIEKIDEPSENVFVYPPDDTYIPTSFMF